MSTVIVGAGIIGVTTAYYLQELGCKEDIHLIEASQEPFSGASGYAAGFLAADWYSTSMLPLGRLSFALHKSLADENDGRKSWAYSGSTGISLGPSLSTSNDECNSDDGDQEEIENGVDWLLQGTSRAQVAARNDRSRNELDDDDNEAPAWLRVHDNQDCEILSRGESTGQVDPLRLCQFLLTKVKERGAIYHGACTAESLVKTENGKLQALELSNGETIPCSKIVFTAGPWTPRAFKTLFSRSSRIQSKVGDIASLAGHSIVVKSPHWSETASQEGRVPKGCHAIFATTFKASKDITGSKSFAPEIFSRLPDEIYVAGLNSSTAPLPERAEDTVIGKEDIELLKEATCKILRFTREEAENLEVVKQGHCFRPTTSTGRPYISAIRSEDLASDCSFVDGGGVWLSAGHGPWGISLSQGTGKVLAEMVLGLRTSIDVSPFSI